MEGFDKVGIYFEIGELIFIFIGVYGFYVQLGEVMEENKKLKCIFLFKGVKLEDVILEMVVGLLVLFCNLGEYLELGKNIKVSLGWFGFYVVYD